MNELTSMVENGGQSGPATELAQQAAERVRQAASWLNEREPGDLVGEFRRLGRQHPGTFLLGAALAGVLVGRLTRGAVEAASSTSSDSQGASSPIGGPQPIVPSYERVPSPPPPPFSAAGLGVGPEPHGQV